MTPEILRVVEQRYLLLPIIDRQWVDHLYVMDHLKTGIGLRGYGQKDPARRVREGSVRDLRVAEEQHRRRGDQGRLPRRDRARSAAAAD